VTIDLDCKLDQDLVDEGLAREIVNRIQKSRKDANLNVSDRIEVTVQTTENLARIFEKFKTHIGSETLMTTGTVSNGPLVNPMGHEIDEETFTLSIRKV
jgi:isoleucyl-tRNA synthetase